MLLHSVSCFMFNATFRSDDIIHLKMPLSMKHCIEFCIRYTTIVMSLISFVFSSWIISEYSEYIYMYIGYHLKTIFLPSLPLDCLWSKYRNIKECTGYLHSLFLSWKKKKYKYVLILFRITIFITNYYIFIILQRYLFLK